MSKAFERLKEANKTSPIIKGGWLDKNRRNVRGDPRLDGVFLKYTLLDRQSFTVRKGDFDPDWKPWWGGSS